MKFIFISLFFAAALHGCVSEKNGGCCPELLLSFAYNLNSDYTNLFETEVDQIVVYIFDSSGRYVGQFTDAGDHLTNDHVMRIHLPEGRYSAVVFGGHLEGYTAGELDSELNTINEQMSSEESTIDDLHIQLDSYMGDDGYYYAENNNFSELYVGLDTTLVSEIRNESISTIELIKNTNHVNVTIIGSESSLSQVESFITYAHGRYNHRNVADVQHGVMKFLPREKLESENTTTHSISIKRLMIGSSTRQSTPIEGDDYSPSITIHNQNSDQPLLKQNLVDAILSTGAYSTQEDLDREDTYNLEVHVDRDIAILVSVNGWIVNEVIPDI